MVSYSKVASQHSITWTMLNCPHQDTAKVKSQNLKIILRYNMQLNYFACEKCSADLMISTFTSFEEAINHVKQEHYSSSSAASSDKSESHGKCWIYFKYFNNINVNFLKSFTLSSISIMHKLIVQWDLLFS